MLRALVLSTVLLTVAPSSALAQILENLTPAQVAEAIALGTKENEARRFLDEYRIRRARKMGEDGPTMGVFTTPFSRVVAQSLEAHERYAAITPDSIEPELLAPEVRVHGWPATVVRGGIPGIASVRAIVLTPANSADRAKAIQPLRTTSDTTTFQNLFGAKTDGAAMVAVFPIAEFTAKRDVHLVFDQKVNAGYFLPCDDCHFGIVLQKIK